MRKRYLPKLEPVQAPTLTYRTRAIVARRQHHGKPAGRAFDRLHVHFGYAWPGFEPARTRACCEAKSRVKVKVTRKLRLQRVSTAILLIGAVVLLGFPGALEQVGASSIASATATTTAPATTTTSDLASSSIDSLASLLEEAENDLAEVHKLLANRTVNQPVESFIGSKSTSVVQSPTTELLSSVVATSTPSALSVSTTLSTSEDSQDESTSAQRDDDDAQDCKGISAHESAEGQKYTDNERLVNLQTCIQAKIKSRILSATRNSMDMFDKLSMSGGCTASFFNLMSSLSAIKSFAFKFLDASAKVPSGVMYGLLSDFGDFDQCLSIRSNPLVPPEEEAEEGAYSGKYCLMSVKLNYRVRLLANESVPEGIVPDGILWDELVRNYWTSKSSKGFQIGVCFPSRCTNDDLDQLYKYVAQSYNVIGEVMNCQDSLDLKRQYSLDTVQKIIMAAFNLLLALTAVGFLADRYGRSWLSTDSFVLEVLLCFSIARNWRRFTNRESLDMPAIVQEEWLKPSQTSGLFCQTQSMEINGDTKEPNTEQTSMCSPQATIVKRSNLNLASRITDTQLNANEDDENEQKTCQLRLAIAASSNGSDGISAGVSALTTETDPTDKQEVLGHLNGLRLLVIVWITIGHSFLYPSANNYQYYRSIININFTRDSVWFATTNFTLGIDTLLYIAGLTFVYKLANVNRRPNKRTARVPLVLGGSRIAKMLILKMLRFWPVYLTLIALALMAPLLSDGPMWPEMVNKRLGAACRNNWWANMLFVSNFLPESEICLPSSWFISILIQLFLIGSLVVLMVHHVSLNAGLLLLATLLAGSCTFSFAYAYLFQVRAPAIKMDESFVMELDETIFRLYTNIFNNLGPFLVGMAGGLLLIRQKSNRIGSSSLEHPLASRSPAMRKRSSKFKQKLLDILVGCIVTIIAALVLSSVFHQDYTRIWSSVYWSLHRVGWAIVSGYVIHNCANDRWRLLNDMISLSTFVPLSKLILIAYLVYPMFIYIHSGLVRDGLHVSIYNMLNIYTTRLVMTFTAALFVHLLVELPVASVEELVMRRIHRSQASDIDRARQSHKRTKTNPLLAAAQVLALNQDNNDDILRRANKGDKFTGVKLEGDSDLARQGE